MRLKRLELQGFKSFLDRTILTFEPGITGVVGPNGCGKSNIVDAIQWVMGEQSAKHLRGDSMTDIIFNGSEHKAASSMAEVTLVMDRKGVPLAPQFASFDKSEEISITRRVYRDGTGEYFINKTLCRLKDIHELFMDTGVGRRAYSIIEQGQIDRMINVKPEERRYLFEEVAGITKYKAKRKEAEKKLEATRQNMLRLQDITTELEKQIRSLKIQATRARKYKELKGELEQIDLFLLGRNLHNHQKAVNELQVRRDLLINERSESDARFGQVEAQVTELEILRIDQEKMIQQFTEKERDLSVRITRLESSLGIFDERKKNLEVSLASASDEISALGIEEETLRVDSERETDEKARLETGLMDLTSNLRGLETELRENHEARERAEEEKEALLDRKMRNSHRLSSLESQKTHGEEKERELESNREILVARVSEIDSSLEQQRAALVEAEQKVGSCQNKAVAAGEEVASVSHEVEETSRKLTDLEENHFKSREHYHTRKSRLESLGELQQNHEGYSAPAREILTRLGGQVPAMPLAEVLQPSPEIEVGLEALLGEDKNTLLVQTTEEAHSLSRLINQQGLERAKILSVSEADSPMPLAVSEPSAIPLLSRVRVKAGYESVANAWLGNSYLVADAEAVFDLRVLYPHATFLTADTRTIGHGDRTLSSGSVPTLGGVFARKREMEELRTECTTLESDLASQSTERENVLKYLQGQEQRHTELKDRLSQIHIENVEVRKEKERLQLEVQRTERDQIGARNEVERTAVLLEDIRSQLQRWTEDFAAGEEEQISIEEELQTADTTVETASQEHERVSAQIQDARVQRSSLEERLNSLQYKLDKIQQDLEQLVRRRSLLEAQRERDQREIDQMASQRQEVEKDAAESRQRHLGTVAELSDVKTAFTDTCTELQELKLQRSDLQKKRETLSAEIQEIEIRGAQENASLEQLKSISMERYQREAVALDETAIIDIEQLPLFSSQLEVGWNELSEKDRDLLLTEHLQQLKEKISRYGEVNLTAIHEFDEIQKRYDFLTEQKTDLEKSIAILEEAILKIDESTKVRFQETFDAVNLKFREIFPILFNGGKAELTLLPPAEGDSLLDAGVDIMVYPPGKRPASITLLSGGEKALTAVSLILAIFARKPSPFCLLDEVDAPLDDANVSRFNTVVRKMAEKTQFILITHNKKTMEVAEALYGVTMEKPGISRMASVRLH